MICLLKAVAKIPRKKALYRSQESIQKIQSTKKKSQKKSIPNRSRRRPLFKKETLVQKRRRLSQHLKPQIT